MDHASDGTEDRVGVLVVDDQEVLRAALRDLVAATPGMTVAGEAASGEEALDAVEAVAPRMVIMDKRMPGMGGIESARRIRERHPEIAVVLVSVEDPTPDALSASGAAAFLHKRELSPRVILDVWRAWDP